VKVQLFEVNASRISGVDKLLDLLWFIAIWLREFPPHTGREIRQPVRVVSTSVIVGAIKYRFDETSDAFSSSEASKKDSLSKSEF
jgi:hypothetical protein